MHAPFPHSNFPVVANTAHLRKGVVELLRTCKVDGLRHNFTASFIRIIDRCVGSQLRMIFVDYINYNVVHDMTNCVVS